MVKLPYSSVVANAELAIVLGPSVAQVTATLLPAWENKSDEYEIYRTWKFAIVRSFFSPVDSEFCFPVLCFVFSIVYLGRTNFLDLLHLFSSAFWVPIICAVILNI
jgi:hypothetical protein